MKKRFWYRPLVVLGLLLAVLAFAGCSGDDGDDGKNGKSAYQIAVDNGFEGTEQDWLDSLQGSSAPQTADPEQCAVCHGDVAGTHAATGVAMISGQDGELDEGGNFVITFNLEVDGVGTNAGFDLYRAYVTFDDPENPAYTNSAAITFNTRTTLYNRSNPSQDPSTDVGITYSSTASGEFTVTIPAASVESDAAYTVLLRNLAAADAWGEKEPGFVLISGDTPLRDLVSDDGMSVGCASCHGSSPSAIFNHYLVKGNECQACHAIYTRSSDSYALINGEWVNQGSVPGSNFTEYVHGIHNSHNMPAGEYYRSGSTQWSVGYPSDMRYCQVCHTTEDQLEAATTAPVSFYLCMTCHQTWEGFVDVHTGEQLIVGTNLDFHVGMGVETNCMNCHGEVPGADEAGDFHNDFQGTDSHYDSFYRGVDLSYDNPDEVMFAFGDITSDGSNVSFTWTATKGGSAVNPCNTDIDAGPTFQALGAYLAYAKGDDWVNEFVGSSPGQPAGARNLFTSLSTSCNENVATTTGLVLDPDTTYAEKVLLAIGGKPLSKFDETGDSYFVRVPSPTKAFDPADGSAVAARRDAVNTEKCLGCHRGTLYQHGGDRVDNEQLCVICHNPSSNDKNNRLDRFQIVNADGTVNTGATYDGKTAETYDMRTMLHAIHGVEQREETGGKPWVVYRSRGIYGFATADAELPVGWPEDGMTIYGSQNGSTIAHNWVVVHYPKAVNDCQACHNEGLYEAADQTKAVGVTIDAGYDWPDQSDDTIIGPSAAACTACHAGAPYRSHAKANGYEANVTKDEMLEKAQ